MGSGFNRRNPPGATGAAAFSVLESSYIGGAAVRGLTWGLSRADFRKLTAGNCHYCGVPPLQVKKAPRNQGNYLYNGIDRVNNDVGYLLSNCVSCCTVCNFAKRHHTLSEFLDWVHRVSAYQDCADLFT